MSTKEAFHKFIDSIEDDMVLKTTFKLVQKAIATNEGALWKNLSEAEKNEILLAVEEEKRRTMQMPTLPMKH